MKFAGIDYGTKRVGIAVSDPDGRIAFPKKIIEGGAALAESLTVFMKEEGIEGIVFGESLTSDGRENEIMADVRRLAAAIKEKTGLPVFFEKEFFTSVEARRMQSHTEVDDSAAALILQRYLDKKNQPQ